MDTKEQICYEVKNWNTHFENSESRKYKSLTWVPVKNKHDGKGYRRLCQHPKSVQVFCAWSLIIQVASKMPTRGLLADGDGPLTTSDLALKTGFPESIFEVALEVLSDPRIAWMGQTKWPPPKTPGDGGRNPVNRTEQNRTEQNRTEQNRTEQNRTELATPREFSERLSTGRVMHRWKEWMNVRRAFKKPKDWGSLFDSQIEWLEAFSEPEVFEILSASIRNGWQGLFPPKGSKHPSKPDHEPSNPSEVVGKIIEL